MRKRNTDPNQAGNLVVNMHVNQKVFINGPALVIFKGVNRQGQAKIVLSAAKSTKIVRLFTYNKANRLGVDKPS